MPIMNSSACSTRAYYTYIHVFTHTSREVKGSSSRRTSLDSSLHSRLLHQKPLQMRINKRHHPPKTHNPEAPKRQRHPLPQRDPVVFLLVPFRVFVIPYIADLFVYGRIIGQDGIEVLSNCPADVAGFIDCPAKYKSCVTAFLEGPVAVHSVDVSVSQRAFDGSELRVERDFG